MTMDVAAIEAAYAEVRAGTRSAVDTARIMADQGVRSYRVDLVTRMMTLYGREGDHHSFSIANGATGQIAPEFSTQAIDRAIVSMRAPGASFGDYFNLMMAAGCVQYLVYLNGRRALYLGPDGQGHMIRLPGRQ